MSVDESVLMQDTSLNQGSEKKSNFELPESFSMSSWSQVPDPFTTHTLPQRRKRDNPTHQSCLSFSDVA